MEFTLIVDGRVTDVTTFTEACRLGKLYAQRKVLVKRASAADVAELQRSLRPATEAEIQALEHHMGLDV